MNKIKILLYTTLVITIAGTIFCIAMGIYLIIRGIKCFNEDKSSTGKTFSIVQVVLGLYLILNIVLAWFNKTVSFSFLGLRYHGSISMASEFILVVIALVVVKDILMERMKLIKAYVWRIELENKLEQEYDEKNLCFFCTDKVKYILNKYLSNIEDVIFDKDESYKVHCYNEKISNLNKKVLKKYSLSKMQKDLDELF